jgi:hypothetical protein
MQSPIHSLMRRAAATVGGVRFVFGRLFGIDVARRDELPCADDWLPPRTSYNPLHVEPRQSAARPTCLPSRATSN